MTNVYVRVHQNISKVRGAANTHLCVSCGDQAHDWAYQYTSTAPLVASDGKVYSNDVNDYEPMCRSCHMKFDYEQDTSVLERVRAGSRKAIVNARKTIASKRETDLEYRKQDDARRAAFTRAGRHASRRALAEKRLTDSEFRERENAHLATIALSGGISSAAVHAEKRRTDSRYREREDMRLAAIASSGGIASAARRRKCSCGKINSPASIGRHQRCSGHTGFEDLS